MFSERVKLLREEKQLSQIELAKLLHIANTTLSMYETGKREPDFETLQLLADFFNVTTDYLLGRTDYRNVREYPLSDFAEHLPEDLREFVLSRKGQQWIGVAAKLDKFDVTPQFVEDLISTVRQLKVQSEEKSKPVE
jgi:transcriptional regulator with XRE-family HTH domain